MYKLWRNVQLSQKVHGLVSRRPLSSMVKDQFHQPDASPEEIRLASERLKIRKALRAEYLRKSTDPHSTDPIIFDPQIQRYYSMHMTLEERFVPTFKNWCVYMATLIIPVILLAQYFRYSKSDFERRCRSGELPYKDRFFKHQ